MAERLRHTADEAEPRNVGILRCKNAQILEIFRAARAQEKIQSELDILLPPSTVPDPFCPPGHLPDATGSHPFEIPEKWYGYHQKWYGTTFDSLPKVGYR